jgi:hypothetical protein
MIGALPIEHNSLGAQKMSAPQFNNNPTLKIPLLSVFACFALVTLLSCNNAEFSGTAKRFSPGSNASLPPNADLRGKGDAGEEDFEDREVDFEKSDDIEISDGDLTLLKQKCWFATSGTYIGAALVAKHRNTFPQTTSGNPIGHGESFDTVGGVFLEANEEAYEKGKGDKLIDAAIKSSFDGIVIAPGMHALIKDADGKKLADEDGPYIGISQYYASLYQASYTNKIKSSTSMPEWMKDVANTNGLQVILLQSATYVKVTPIAGEACDF